MNKSFQTSGGTVLSTNWKEVRSNTYPLTPYNTPQCTPVIIMTLSPCFTPVYR